MAETFAHDVVKEAQSVGSHHQPSDESATTSNDVSAGNGQATTIIEPPQAPTAKTNEADGRIDAIVSDAGGAAATTAEETVLADESGDAVASGGEGGLASHSAAESLAQALADASGGSDTDTSRNDAADASKEDGKGHVRTGSVKKPASFKPVSVTKSFLAKSLSASPVPRTGEKTVANAPSPVSALQGAAKPRLVAKSALGGKGMGMAKLNGTGGPDPSKVWNKNRPAPPPAPRQFTDEELQTRYGIHMTARLQSDEAGKDSKWADIDDDEDDWAPETVEWMDGTKSNVGATDGPAQMPPLRQEDRVPSPGDVNKPAEAVKPVLTTMHKPSVSQTTKTILRPGAQLNASTKPGQAPKSGDKGASLTSKPAAPPKVSPWAVLPPVEKVAPINPPIQQPQRPFQRDPQGFDALPPAPSATQEIAADDFSRSIGGDRGPRELFNAHSGRYEAAGDARRGSRQEHGYRQPAVLQRPPHGGPAEPSAAFQTHRSSIEGGAPWGRRRASSSLSASGARRPSFAGSQEYIPGAHDVAIESPKAPFANLDRSGPWVRGQHPPTEPPVPEQAPLPQAPQEPDEDPVAKQQRLMKEKIERARAAKQKEIEAEAAEAAARQERLKLKMAQLAAASPSPDAAAKDAVKTSAASMPPKSTAMSPPKPPVPTSDGEPAQYGLMKVHQPHPVKKNHISEASLTAKSNESIGENYGQGYRDSTSPNKSVAGPTPTQPHQHTADRAPQKGLPNPPATTAPLEKLGSSWKSSPSPNDYNWSSNTMAARSAVGASVWGPPGPTLSNEKSLGNGTFDSKFSHPNYNNRFGNNSREGGLLQGPSHGPIGSGLKGTHTPPSSSQNQQPRQSAFAQTFQNLAGASDKTQQEQLPISKPSHSPSIDDQAFASAHLDSSLQQSIEKSSSLHPQTASPLANSSYNNSNMSAQVSMPPAPIGGKAPIGSGQQTIGHSQKWMDDNRGATASGWKNFRADEQQRMGAAISHYQANLPAAPKASLATSYEIYRDMQFNQVQVLRVTVQSDGTKSIRPITQVASTPHNTAKVKESLAQHPDDHASLAGQASSNTTISVPAPTTSSRFFPKTAPPPAINVHLASNENEAPPPAEQGLFEHDASQPAKVKFPIVAKVNLPGMKAPLPPRSPGLDKTFGAPPPAAPATRAKPGLMHADDLKAKFGHLNLGAGGIFASTKPTFEADQVHARPNGVVKPRVAASPKPLFSLDTSADPISKSIAEDECIDFPDFGSKPTVRVPTVPHKNHQFGYSHDSGMLGPSGSRSRFSQKFQPLTTQSIPGDNAYLFKGDYKVAIKVPGMETAKHVAPLRRSPGNVSPANGSGFRGGRGGYAPRGTRGGFSGPSPRGARGGMGTPRGGSTAVSSSSSSPKPRGWAPRQTPVAGQ